jgi:hypothetical protein
MGNESFVFLLRNFRRESLRGNSFYFSCGILDRLRLMQLEQATKAKDTWRSLEFIVLKLMEKRVDKTV